LKALIFGSKGLVGSSLVRNLPKSNKISKIIPSTRSDTDLFSLDETRRIIKDSNPDYIVNAAAKVGGILANNSFRTEFILENLKINMNILEAIVDRPNIKLINLGSSCIYPLNAENPIKESSLMNGKLEPTNSPYAMAKLTAIEIGDALVKEHGHKIINIMPTNLYGPNDNFSDKSSHVIPGLIYRMHKAKIEKMDDFEVWGSGKPLREFLYVDDLANAINFIIDNDIEEKILNIGSGYEISIKELAESIKEIIKYEGILVFNKELPDGNPRKLLDSSKIEKLGWASEIDLIKGLDLTYDWYKENL
tara:strand:+ start:66 stop:983 length:918 start_codon:yes stop_codon:yes gene_type:complete